MTTTPKDNISAWIWLTPAILLALFCALLFTEWYRVGVISDPLVIKQYPFGGEGPVADAPNYASAEA
ncbi:hypothetical protein KJ836_03650 [Patescibacteria group bacterium]|nr:hypothetical protein [Patescibacteria group bacterium]